MSFRCTNAFLFADKLYPGGVLIADDDPILQTHAGHFAEVTYPAAGVETATAAPGEKREAQPDLAAYLAAEDAHNTAVVEWLAAEEQHNAASAAQTPPAPARGSTTRTKGTN